MSTVTEPFTIEFLAGFNEMEMTAKGFLPDVLVKLPDGSQFTLFFFDPVRLRQELDAVTADGTPYVAEPNMVVVPTITPQSVKKAVEGLLHDGYFSQLKSS